jgi:hypothetical protein
LLAIYRTVNSVVWQKAGELTSLYPGYRLARAEPDGTLDGRDQFFADLIHDYVAEVFVIEFEHLGRGHLALAMALAEVFIHLDFQ